MPQSCLCGTDIPRLPVTVPPSLHGLDVHQKGRILLVGFGPGHPFLFTPATHKPLTQLADLVRIAKKLPGNAEGTQTEMMEAVVEAARYPVVYGRVGEERGEALAVCTGVGCKDKDVQLPGYERSHTLVVLMGRVCAPYTPIAIVERVVMSTLRDVVTAFDSVWEQRPPGIMVIGWAVLALWEAGDVDVLDKGAEKDDDAPVTRWLGKDARWRIREGLPEGWDY
ncbi:hypothetical protein B0H19DRAFT_1211226 [Mycena capillaripes]|nr:hypothetical protein B0H19DRAFT_1211226 [Mycena capillaripes]